ncbi:RagB/SusD family nutrient uptake outer membrane protein [Empedobacter falsenii]
MKKHIYRLLFIVPILLSSCSEDRLDLIPEVGDVYDGNLKNEDQMAQVVQGIYPKLGSGSNFGADILIQGELLSDNIFVSNASGDIAYVNTAAFAWHSGNSPFGQYRGLYEVVQQANLVLNDTNVPINDNVLSLKGEAKIARALAMFYLVQGFSPNPTSGVNQEYGIPIKNDIYDPQKTVGRSTIDEVYDFIIRDLTEGIEGMANSSRQDKIYLSATAGKYLLSKVYLTRGKSGDYQKSIDLVDDILKSSSNFSMIEASGLVNYFTSKEISLLENQPETIFEISQTSISNLGINTHPGQYYTFNASKRRLMMRTSLYNTMNSTKDVRLSLFQTAQAPTVDDPKGVWLKKVPQSTSEGANTANVKVFRMTELLFIKMEALAKLGRKSEALTLLNEFALTRKSSVYKGDDIITDILTEKQKEFIGEGLRFYDLKRNNLPIVKTSNCNGNICEVSANDKLFVFPIPIGELDRAPEMKQYPGW